MVKEETQETMADVKKDEYFTLAEPQTLEEIVWAIIDYACKGYSLVDDEDENGNIMEKDVDIKHLKYIFGQISTLSDIDLRIKLQIPQRPSN